MSLEILSRDILLKIDSKKSQSEQLLAYELEVLQKESDLRIKNFYYIFSNQIEEEILKRNLKILGTYKSHAKTISIETESLIINQVKNNFVGELNNLSNEKKEKLFKILLKKANTIFSTKFISTNKKDSDLLSKLTSEKILIKKNINGLYLENEDKTEILDLTFKSISDEIFHKNLEKVKEIVLK